MKESFYLGSTPSRWARFGAKCLDYTLLYLIFSFFVEGAILFIGSFVFWIFIQAASTSIWKTTLGKALFGIRLEDHVGGKMPFFLALKRAISFKSFPGVLRQKPLSFIRKILAVTLCATSLSLSVIGVDTFILPGKAAVSQSIEGWIDYSPENDQFRVLFPKTPEEISSTLPAENKENALQYEEAKSHEGKKIFYSVSYVKLPSKWKLAGATRLLQGALDLILEHTPGSKLLQKNFTKHGSYRAIDFHMDQEGKEVKGRLILVGTTLYRLTIVYPEGLGDEAQDQAFIDSFEVMH